MARRYTSYEVAQRLAFSEKAVRTSLISFSVDYSNRCSDPKQVELIGLPDPILHRVRKARFKRGDLLPSWSNDGIRLTMPADDPRARLRPRRMRVYIDLSIPCRLCTNCLAARGRLWCARALNETRASKRTWFCTFTVNAHHRVRFSILARRRYGDESYASLYKVLSSHFTRYLKRVRKESGAKLRFLLAAEAHKDGWPHLHALVHETDAIGVTKRCLQGQWPYGFTHVKLAAPATASYVTKYLAKEMLSRVRASLKYGSCDNVLGHREEEGLPQDDRQPSTSPQATAIFGGELSHDTKFDTAASFSESESDDDGLARHRRIF